MISNRQIEYLLVPYGITLSLGQLANVRAYVSLLLHWRRVVSLTTVAEPAEIVKRHFGESFFAVRAVPFETGRLADIGSGAGFPGAAIAILCPSIHATLIESNSRKAAFLETLRAELGLKNLDVANKRAEDAHAILTACDFVTARALGRYRELLGAIRKRVQWSAKIILWLGANDAAELRALDGWAWRLEVKIPESQRRVLLVGSPASSVGSREGASAEDS